MKKRILLGLAIALPGVCGVLLLWPAPRCLLLGSLRHERFYGGWPARYWIEELVEEQPAEHRLVTFLRSLNPFGRASNTSVLLRVKKPCPASVPLLVGMLHDADPELRWRAALVLSHTRPRQAISALLEATRDPDVRVRL